MKKFFSLLLAVVVTLGAFALLPENYSADEKYDAVVSNGSYSTLQNELDKAQSLGTSKKPYTIHITKNVKVTNELCVYSNTKLVIDKGVVLTRKMGKSSKSPMLRFGYHGSYSSGYKYKNITIQGGVWDGNGTKKDSGFCIFKLSHAQNVKILNVTFKKDVEEHMIEVGAVNTMTVKGCVFRDHISKDTSYEHEEALQIDVNHSVTTKMGNFDKYQNKNMTITNCKFINVGRGIGSHNTIEGVYFTNMHINNNTFTKLKSYPIMCVNYRSSTINNNKINSCPGGIMFMNVKPDYKTANNSYICPKWKLKLDTKKDNSVISGNVIKKSKGSKDEKCIVIYGTNISKAIKNRYLKGDHYVKGVTVKNNTIESPDGTGILINGGKNCKVTGNNIKFTGKSGEYYGVFLQEHSNGTKVSNNKISKFYDGVTVTDSNNVNITSNKITSSRRDGVTIKSSSGFTLSKNTIKSTKDQGIYLAKSKGSIKSCTVDKVKTKHGIAVNDKSNAKITSCTVKNCKEWGIMVKNSKATIKSCKYANNHSGNVYRG